MLSWKKLLKRDVEEVKEIEKERNELIAKMAELAESCKKQQTAMER